MENNLIIDHGWTGDGILAECFTDEHRKEFKRLGIQTTVSHKRSGSFSYWSRKRVPSDFVQLNIRFFDSHQQTVRTFIRPKIGESNRYLDLAKVHQRATEMIQKAEQDQEFRKQRQERIKTEQAKRRDSEAKLAEAGFECDHRVAINRSNRLEIKLEFDDVDKGLAFAELVRGMGYLK